MSLASFTTFAALGFQLTAAVAFPALALFNLLRFPIMQLPNQITNVINAGVGLGRLQAFLDADEMTPLPLEPPGAWGETAAEIKHGTFFWESGVLSATPAFPSCLFAANVEVFQRCVAYSSHLLEA